MRILRLVAEGEYALEFHPYVTVVTGLSDEQRAGVLGAFKQAVAGRPTHLTGLLEVHGVVLDMDERSFQLLDLGDTSVDLVVDAEALPGAATSAMGRRLESAQRRLEQLEVPHRERREALRVAEAAVDAEALGAARALPVDDSPLDDGAADELVAIEAELARAEQALEALAGPGSQGAGALQAAERELEEATRERDSLGSNDLPDADGLHERRDELLAELRADDPDEVEVALARAAETQAQLDESLASLDVALAAMGDREPPGVDDRDDVEEEEEEEEEEDGEVADDDTDATEIARVNELRAVLALQESFDPKAVRAALDASRLNLSAGDLVPSPEARSLADGLEQLGRRIDDLERRSEEPPEPGAIDAARSRLDEVRAALVAAERSSPTSRQVDEDIEELERVHAEVVEATEALEGRFGRAKAESRMEAARAAEDAVLERLGIRSYTDFMSGGRANMHASAEPDDLRNLRAEERDTEWTLRGLEHQMNLALELAEVVEDRRQARAQGRQMLVDRDVSDVAIVSELLDLRIPAGRDSPASALVDALESVGLPVRALDFSSDELETMAAEWLGEYFRVEQRRAQILHELSVLESGESETVAEEVIIPESDRRAASLAEAEAAVEAANEANAAAQEIVRLATERVTERERVTAALVEVEGQIESAITAAQVVDARSDRVDADEVAVAKARDENDRLDSERIALESDVVRLRSEIVQRARATEHTTSARTDTVDRAESEAATAAARLRDARTEFDDARTEYDSAVEEVASLRNTVAEMADEQAPIDEIEWYLLARLAGQRQVSFSGSVPMVVDRALDGVEDDGLVHLLDRLERMAGAVQVVHLSDDERIIEWAKRAGEDRVAVVGPLAALRSARMPD